MRRLSFADTHSSADMVRIIRVMKIGRYSDGEKKGNKENTYMPTCKSFKSLISFKTRDPACSAGKIKN